MPILKSKRQILKFEVFAYILCHRLRDGTMGTLQCTTCLYR